MHVGVMHAVCCLCILRLCGTSFERQPLQVSVKPGETVKAGQVVAVMSAMKMETTVGCPCDGVISHVAVIVNDVLDAGDLLMRITPDGAAPAAVPTAATGS
jgi:pyruvate dehydrogenase E2 component (dihydrolipoamide acetyltransferase)